MSQVTTHVTDTAFGGPAVGVGVTFDRKGDDGWLELGGGATDIDGRIYSLGPQRLPSGVYRLTFATGDYFLATERPAFYPEVQITFLVTGTDHYHVPLLLSPFAYSTYRGS
jgi:5-hydroxyisourate hydrolase